MECFHKCSVCDTITSYTFSCSDNAIIEILILKCERCGKYEKGHSN